MYVFSTFEHSVFLELVIATLEEKGLPRNRILAVPLEKRYEGRKILDTIHQSDGRSLFDGAAVIGTVFMVLGVIYGFTWKWGPIIWGIIGLAIGGGLGFLLDMIITTSQGSRKKSQTKATEIILIINCEGNQVEMIENILWEHLALGVARLDQEKTMESEVEA